MLGGEELAAELAEFLVRGVLLALWEGALAVLDDGLELRYLMAQVVHLRGNHRSAFRELRTSYGSAYVELFSKVMNVYSSQLSVAQCPLPGPTTFLRTYLDVLQESLGLQYFDRERASACLVRTTTQQHSPVS